MYRGERRSSPPEAGRPRCVANQVAAAIALGAVAAAATGCELGPAVPLYAPPYPFAALRKPAPTPNPLFVPAQSADLIWDGVVDAMDDYFPVDWEDPIRVVDGVVLEGRLQTVPVTGATLLEPWRRDSSTAQARLESTLQSIRRRGEATATPTSGGYLIYVAVYQELEDVPTPENSAASASNFSNSDSPRRFDAPTAAAPPTLGWISQGRDECLEQRILCNIASRLLPAGRR